MRLRLTKTLPVPSWHVLSELRGGAPATAQVLTPVWGGGGLKT